MADAREILGNQYDTVLEHVERARKSDGDGATDALAAQFMILEEMVAQVLYHKVGSELPDGEEIRDKRAQERMTLLDELGAVVDTDSADERGKAASQLQKSLARRRKHDVEKMLPLLEDAGVDLDHLGNLMRIHAKRG